MRNNEKFQFVAIGDVFLKSKTGEQNPFHEEIEEFFKGQQHVLINLETVIADYGVAKPKAVTLKSDLSMSLYLQRVGVTMANIANNHTFDYGTQGLSSTVNALKDAGVKIVGLTRDGKQKAGVIELENSLRVGTLAYTIGVQSEGTKGTIGIARLNEKRILKDIDTLKSNDIDRIIISLHWGEEYVIYPDPEQQRLARALIDNGADIIIGHHPHVLQGIEKYNDGIIFYSIGNFNFGSLSYLSQKHHNSRWGLIVMLELNTDKKVEYKILPIKIDKNYRPKFARDKERKMIIQHIEDISIPLIPKINNLFWFREASIIHFSNHLPSFIKRIKNHGIAHLLLMVKWLIKPRTGLYYIGLLLFFISRVSNAIFPDIKYLQEKK